MLALVKGVSIEVKKYPESEKQSIFYKTKHSAYGSDVRDDALDVSYTSTCPALAVAVGVVLQVFFPTGHFQQATGRLLFTGPLFQLTAPASHAGQLSHTGSLTVKVTTSG